jgi:hypothetical protein
MIDKDTILEEVEEYVSLLREGEVITTKQFKKNLSISNNRSEGSYIPSDYCYNRTNKGINYETQPHYFLYVKRGLYKYVGKDYQFNGIIVHEPRYA